MFSKELPWLRKLEMNPSSTSDMLGMKRETSPSSIALGNFLLRRQLFGKIALQGTHAYSAGDFYSYWGKTNFLVNR